MPDYILLPTATLAEYQALSASSTPIEGDGYVRVRLEEAITPTDSIIPVEVDANGKDIPFILPDGSTLGTII